MSGTGVLSVIRYAIPVLLSHTLRYAMSGTAIAYISCLVRQAMAGTVSGVDAISGTDVGYATIRPQGGWIRKSCWRP
eukprot:2572222-Rhodomonas_salina.2